MEEQNPDEIKLTDSPIPEPVIADPVPSNTESLEGDNEPKPDSESDKGLPPWIGVLVIFAIAAVLAGNWGYGKIKNQKQSFDSQILGLQTQIAGLQKQFNQTQKQNADTKLENQHLQEIHAKSQDQLLTDAVSKVTPAVVSIVISKDVPKLSVTYQNPFGDDPFFKDFGFQVPVYQQNGVEHQKIGAGTGFLISANGYILTNKHVVYDDGADYTVLLSNGTQKPAKVVYKDASTDVAIISIGGNNFAHVSLGDSTALKLGQTVVAIGNALGEYDNSVSLGVVSGLNRTIQASGEGGLGAETLNDVVQTDAAINPGNSGGPLLDLNGNVVGVNVATVQGSSNISFAIPINSVKGIIKTVLK